MSKGLEALKQYRSQQTGVNVYADELLDTVEKELKRLEDIDSILNTGGGIWACNGVIDKKFKALEIIRNKRVSIIDIVIYNCSLEKYNYKNYFKLTQEEYDLLEEVLL